MTIQEAKQQINACESQITEAYSNLCGAARSMGESANQAASSTTTKSTLWPLIISMVGVILCFSSHFIWGIIAIIAGIFIAHQTHQVAAAGQNNVEQLVQSLNETLSSNSKI